MKLKLWFEAQVVGCLSDGVILIANKDFPNMSCCSFINLKNFIVLFLCLMLNVVNFSVGYESMRCFDEDSALECQKDARKGHCTKAIWREFMESGCNKTCQYCLECKPQLCSPDAICHPGNDSYNCSCKSGFSGDGFTCTDINECTTGQHQCSINGACSNTNGSYTCQCKFGYFGNGTTCDDGSNRVVCNETSMAIFLDNRTQLYDGSSITLNDTSCTGKRYFPNNEYGLATTYDKCGTTRTEKSTHIVYENEVMWTFGNTTSKLVRSTGKRIIFRCLLERTKNTSTIRLEPVKTFITATEVGFGTFTVSMSMFKDKTFTTMQSIFPATVKLDQRLYFEVQVGTNDTNLVLLIERCSATPTTDINHVSSYDLINERCASDTTIQFISATPSHKMRFSFMSFKFFGYTYVYLHCQTFMCHKQSSDSRCTSGCQGNNIKRVRRSALLESDEIGLRSLKTRGSEEEEVNDYPPSKTYLNIGPFVESKDKATGSGKQRDVKSSFTFAHGMILLNAILATTLGLFIAKAIVKKRRRTKKKQQGGFKTKQDNLSKYFNSLQ